MLQAQESDFDLFIIQSGISIDFVVTFRVFFTSQSHFSKVFVSVIVSVEAEVRFSHNYEFGKITEKLRVKITVRICVFW